jgi:hypothetical protein
VVKVLAIMAAAVVLVAAGSSAQEPRYGIVGFTKADAGDWNFQWHIVLAPEDTRRGEFRIIGRLRSGEPAGIRQAPGFDAGVLSAVLVDAREIQPHAGDPVNIKFRLAAASHVQPQVRSYRYLSVPYGFSRIGGFRNGNIPNPVRPYGMSSWMNMLGSQILDRRFAATGNFLADSKIPLATIQTAETGRLYTYEIFLEKYQTRP